MEALKFFKRQQSSFKVNLLKNMFQNFSMGLTQQYQSVYITLLGANPLQLGFATSVGGLVNALVTIPSGHLANKFGIRKVLLSSLLIMASGYALFALTRGWLLTIPGLAIVSLGWGSSMVVCPLICGNCLRSEERATGMQICDTLSAVPRLFAPIIAAFVITMFGGLSARGIRPLYWLEVMGLLVSSVIIFKFFRDPIRGSSETVTSLRDEMKRVFTEGVMVKRWLVYIVVSILPIYMAIYIPLYAKQFKGADQYILGLMDAAYWLTIVIFALPTGIWADRIGRKRLVMLLTPLYSSSLILLVIASNNILLIFVGLLNGSIMLTAVTQGAITAELVPRELLGGWYGIIGLARGLGNLIAPLLGGIIWDFFGPAYLFILLAITQILKLPILASIPSSLTRD